MRALVTWRAAVVAVVLVAAGCGNSDGGDGKLRKLPIGAAGSGRSSAAMSSEAGADSASAMMAPLRAVEYRVAEDADPVPEEATAYVVTSRPANEVRAKVAEALDVDEDAVEVGAMGFDWFYSGTSPDSAVSSSIAPTPACSSDEKCVEPPPPSPPPTVAGVPTAAEAEERVRELLRSLGVSLDGRFEVFGEDGYNRTVQFTPSVDGVPVAGLQTQVAFGGNGRIEYANGLLADIEPIGEYPLVGLAEAVRRLQEGFGSGGVQTMGAPEPAIASDPAATSGASQGSTGSGTVEPDRGSATGGGSTGSTGSAGGEDVAPPEPVVDQPACAPGETCAVPPSPPPGEPTMTIEPDPGIPPEPLEAQVIEITGAEVSLQLVAAGCPGDPVYLVPTFDLLPGPAASVIAVDDDALLGQGAVGGAGADAKGAREFEPCPGDEPMGVPEGKPEPAPMPADAGREPAKP